MNTENIRERHLAMIKYTWFKRGFSDGAGGHMNRWKDDLTISKENQAMYDEGYNEGRTIQNNALSAAAARFGNSLDPLRAERAYPITRTPTEAEISASIAER